MKMDFPDPDDILNFTLTIEPDEGLYKGGSFAFTFAINSAFPHEPPKVKCTQKIYHPNIDIEGNVCLNILREDWKPVLNLNAVIVGLQYLFLEPNPMDPLNKGKFGSSNPVIQFLEMAEVVTGSKMLILLCYRGSRGSQKQQGYVCPQRTQ